MTLRTNFFTTLAAAVCLLGVLHHPFLSAQQKPEAPTVAPEWKAAVAKTVITPREPMYLAGFANREVPAEGILTDLHAKALSIEDPSGTRFVLVTLDLIEITYQLRDAVIAEIHAKYGLPKSALMMNSSHSHSGPELRYTDLQFEGLSDPLRKERCLRYNEFLKNKIVEIVDQTLTSLAPVTLSYGHARCGFAMNRRLKVEAADGTSSWRNSPNPDGVVDHEVPVLSVRRSVDSELIAIAFGYACHNTSLNLKLWSADYAGYAQTALEDTFPGAIALFVMGCGGDQNPYPRFSPLYSARHGQSLATAVEAAISAKNNPVTGPLQIDWQTARIDYQSIPTEADLKKSLETSKNSKHQWDENRLKALQRGELRDHYDFPIQVVRFGDSLTLIGLSGETCVDYSLRLKREYKGLGRLWVAGYCNDVLAYIPSKRVLEEGGYEGGSSLTYWSNPVHPSYFSDTIEERIIAKVHEMWK